MRSQSQYSQASGDWEAVQQMDELRKQQFYAESHAQFQMNQQRYWQSQVPASVQNVLGILVILAIPALFLAYHVF